jgi:hypothetical protein
VRQTKATKVKQTAREEIAELIGHRLEEQLATSDRPALPAAMSSERLAVKL